MVDTPIERLLNHARNEQNSEIGQHEKALAEHRYVDAQVHHFLAEEHYYYFRFINAMLRESGWQSIENAPKDGTQFLATGVECDGRANPRRRWGVSYWCEGYWLGGHFTSHCVPTHWMPLPEPPPTEEKVDGV